MEGRWRERTGWERGSEAECGGLKLGVGRVRRDGHELDLGLTADVQLDLYVGPKQQEQGLSQKLLSIHGICSTNWAAFSGLSRRGST